MGAPLVANPICLSERRATGDGRRATCDGRRATNDNNKLKTLTKRRAAIQFVCSITDLAAFNEI